MATAHKPKSAKNPNVLVDYHLTVRKKDRDLMAFIRDQSAIHERNISQQIIYMLRFAAAQMSAHDLEPK